MKLPSVIVQNNEYRLVLKQYGNGREVILEVKDTDALGDSAWRQIHTLKFNAPYWNTETEYVKYGETGAVDRMLALALNDVCMWKCKFVALKQQVASSVGDVV
jgi:hypothetical protein